MKKQQEIDWIFFDVGGVIMDDRESEEWRKENVLAVVSELDPRLKREDIDTAFYRGSSFVGNTDDNIIRVLFKDSEIQQKLIEKVKSRRLARWSSMQEFADRSLFTEGVLEVVRELSKNYNLGIIANQPQETNKRLESFGLLKYFKIVGMSHSAGLHKPDLELFKTILQEAGVLPERAAMLDDNIERGLVPAKTLGMKTVWFDWGYRQDPPNWMDYKITRLKDLLDIF